MSRIETILGAFLFVLSVGLTLYVLVSLPSQKEIQSIIQGVSK